MRIKNLIETVKCDTILCNQNAAIEIETNSFKGSSFLCEMCYKELAKLLKGNLNKNETKK